MKKPTRRCLKDILIVSGICGAAYMLFGYIGLAIAILYFIMK